MLEMATDIPTGEESRTLADLASRLTGVLYREAAVKDPAVSDGQLLHGTYARKSPFNTVNNRGVDECNTWGDYYYVEALRRLKGKWDPYW
jgi:unsaturated chondroitin disaccharide hydrolase